jgi:hypothetical protein
MLSGPFLSNFVLLLSEHHHHFAHRLLLQCAKTLSCMGFVVRAVWFSLQRRDAFKTVTFLVKSGADIHTSKDKPLRCASMRGHVPQKNVDRR